ncbi:PREDICTED: NACHT, LRR and PYD domains-containing protein 14 [Elephantulus edwardii]|uniref:NACHT, LRR and PYD domains-containing protein 14 n=1 Tax=Elephantulus edwardii TaxID=28737 RepID=UPI0003F0AE10|nr:PREDICTED: NACHT, LRR and PYD domains-containing protein 14 [Elephantulus edwardii]
MATSSTFFSDYGLLWYLEKLDKEEFKKFKFLLNDEVVEPGRQKIPWGEVKKASKEDLANLISKYYPEKKAWKVTLKIFDKIGLKHLCQQATAEMSSIVQTMKPEDTMEVEGGEEAVLGDGTEYKSHIQAKFGTMRNKTHLLGEPEDFYHKIIQENQELLEHLFDVDVKTGEHSPLTVVLQGPAGIGKTTLMRKAMLEWAEGNLYQQKFAYVFYLNAREINSMREMSFVQLLSKYWPSREGPIERIMSQPGQLLFIIDSFDELDFAFEEPDSELTNNRTQDHPVSFLISSLLRKAMLPESSLLITTKPTTYKKLKSLLKSPRWVELAGMSKDARKEYIFQFFEDPEWAIQAFRSLRNNEILFNICQVPLLCKVICTCLKQQMEKGADITVICQTTTALFTCFISSLYTLDDISSPPLPNQFQLKNLCYLAAKGIWTMTYVFYKDNLKKHGLKHDDISVFLNMNILKKDLDYENCYTFTYLHVQQFFGAMFYVVKGNWQVKDLSYQPFEDLNQFLDSEDIHLRQMKYFLFGLVNEYIIKQLEKIFKCKMSLDLKWELIEWAGILANSGRPPAELRLLELFYCLYETQYEPFLIQVMTHFKTVDINICEKIHLHMSSFCLKYCSFLQTVKLSANMVGEEMLMSPDEAWQIDCDHITQCWQNFFSVLHTNEFLRELELFNSNLDELATKILYEELKHPNCNLQKLLLRFVSFPDNCKSVFNALTQSPNLIHLDLKGSDIGDKGLKLLCEDLKHPECKLQNLSLEKCGLTVAGCEYLASVLISNKRLKYLSLADNALGDSGIKLISGTLKQPQCTLQSLELTGCALTSACCLDLGYVILNNSNLRILDLGNNDLQDKGVKILCEALRHPNCNIHQLGLEYCGLTSLCCQDLSSSLSINQRLIKINLKRNAFGYEGIKKLCEVLKSPECKLQILGLKKEEFDEASQKLLKAVELSNPCLTITFDDKNEDESCDGIVEILDKGVGLAWNILTLTTYYAGVEMAASPTPTLTRGYHAPIRSPEDEVTLSCGSPLRTRLRKRHAVTASQGQYITPPHGQYPIPKRAG